MDARSGSRGPDGPLRWRLALSLPEVLVVAGLIMLLLAMLFPGLSAVRERVRRIQCANNLKQWGLALVAYRHENKDYIPSEGTYLRPDQPYTWFNVLPPYLDAPSYGEVERIGAKIKEFPSLHIWICPSKNMSRLNTSGTGKNQFHYGMNAVLDGMNSSHTPEFPDQPNRPLHTASFAKKPHTVFMFDIYRNDSRGYQKDVATKFHGNFANVLYLEGAVANFRSVDFVENGDFRRPKPIWNHSNLYWGYTPPRE